MYLTDREDLQSIHADFGVEKLQFAVTGINNNLDSINCKYINATNINSGWAKNWTVVL